MIKASFNFTKSITAERVEKILGAVFELIFSKGDLIKPSSRQEFYPFKLWQLKVLLGDGLINDKTFF